MPHNPLISERKRKKLQRQSFDYCSYHCPNCMKENAHKIEYLMFQCGYCGHQAHTSKMIPISYQRKKLANLVPQSRLDVLDMLEQYRAKNYTPPTLRELAFALDVSHDTIRRSIEELKILGLIGYAKAGRRLPRTLHVKITRKEWDNASTT